MEAEEGASRRWLLGKTPLSRLREEGRLPHAGAGHDGAEAGTGDVGAHEEEGDVADLPRGPALEGNEDGRRQMMTGHSAG